MPIHLLSEDTINKIAAGEVIENPASVVKELMENAIDAGGESLTVAIERGGFSLIRVIDDGMGMGKDDLLLSIERHATSKIQSVDDLTHVLTMGFRGEALASIGAVSKMKIVTASGETGEGIGLCCSGRTLFPPFLTSRNRGTTVEVRSLFYNVPARLKFQKSASASQQAITKWLIRVSLAYPKKTFRYVCDGKEMMHLLPGGVQERAVQTIGDAFVRKALSVHFSDGDVKVEGLIGSPMDGKSNRLGQHLFVNGRAADSLPISSAVQAGYGTRLSSHLHPIYVLYLTLPTHWVDVNVHPQKKEVRFLEETKIQAIVRQGVEEAFHGTHKAHRDEKHSFSRIEWNPSFHLKLQETSASHPAPLSFQFHQKDELPIVGLFDSYLIVHPTPLFDLQVDKGIYLIDLEKAFGRILYERFLQKEPPPIQPLLFPLTIELTLQETNQLLLHEQDLKKIGILIRQFGDNACLVEALSPDIEEKRLQPLLEQCAHIFDENLTQKEREKKLALSVACSARSQKQVWSLVEAKQIVLALFKTNSPYYCPKGEKTIIALSHETIKSLFKKKNGSISKPMEFQGP